jgi:hypothetical protein
MKVKEYFKSQPVVIWCDDLGYAGNLSDTEGDAGAGEFTIGTGATLLHDILTTHGRARVTHFVVPQWAKHFKYYGVRRSWDVAGSIENIGHWLRKMEGLDCYEFQPHGYTHEYSISGIFKRRNTQEFENLNYSEGNERIQKSIALFNSVFKKSANGFRFPGWKAGKSFAALKPNGIEWASDFQSIDNFEIRDGIINLPIGYRLHNLSDDEVKASLDSGSGLFITTHVQGRSPTAKTVNGIYHQAERLIQVLSLIDRYDVCWLTGSEVAREIIRADR